MKNSAIIYISLICLIVMCHAPVFSDESYRVGIGDVLRITVIGKQDYRVQEDVEVKSSGEILLSIMTSGFPVAGKTLKEINKELTDILAKDYIVDPKVIVEVAEYHSHKILVIGEVKKPGELTIEKETLPIKELLIKTGGPIGDMNKTVVIIHADTSDQKEPTIKPLDQILMDHSVNETFVETGDIVYFLSKDKNLPIQDLENIIYVFGQVKNPGLIPYSQNLTVLRAIINAGNFTKEAAPGRTTVKRRKGKKIITIDVDLDKVMSGGDKQADIPVQPGDVIYVPRAIF